MNVLEAALKVLQEAGKPLHSQEITDCIIAGNLWQSSGKTPAATVEAAICVDMKKKADSSVFVRVASRTFGLNKRDVSQVNGQSLATVPLKNLPSNKDISKSYSFSDAAERVIEQFGNKQPMHYRAITEKAMEMNWLNTEGKTPEATMYAQIITEIKRYQKRGEQPRFAMHGKGYVGLTRWMGRGLAFEIEQHNKRVRQALHKRLLAMRPDEFEELIALLLAEIGFENIEVTKLSGDGGIDVRGTLVVGDVIRTRMSVQAKKWKPGNNVQAPVVQRVRGSISTHEQGLIITTSDFSPGARAEAARIDKIPVALMNGEQLVMLLVEYNLGVTRCSHDLIELDEDGVVLESSLGIS
ncbi:MAG: restriction endonuclease [Candidatus Schekmanbacteria bacterium]|nr:restriction endonuclease [Candidatus Schekmanbacteria bacterium]